VVGFDVADGRGGVGVTVGGVGGSVVGRGLTVVAGGTGVEVVRVAPMATPLAAATARTAVAVVRTTRRW
jgi:hypothetical protein